MKPYGFNPKKKYSLKRYCSICKKPINQNKDIFYKPIPEMGSGQRWIACSYSHATEMSADFIRIHKGKP